MVPDRYSDLVTLLRFPPEEIPERKLVWENIKNAGKPLSPEKSRKVSEIFSIFEKKLKLTKAEIARGMSIDPKKLRRLCNREQPWKVGDVVKLEQAFPYWKDLAEKPDTPAQGSFCPNCGSNKISVERTSTSSATGIGCEDVIFERKRKCLAPTCKQRWKTYEISKERFEEIAEKLLKKEVGLVKEYQRSVPPDQPNSLDEFDLKIEKLKIVFDKGLITPVELKTEILKLVKE